MKSTFQTCGIAIACGVSLLLIGLVLIDASDRGMKGHVSQLHPRVQEAIHAYISEQAQLAVGDLVDVRDLDNLESARTLVVEKVEGDFLYSRVILTDGRAWEGKPERMILESGLRAGVAMTSKHAFRFIRKDHDAWPAMVAWYWLQ